MPIKYALNENNLTTDPNDHAAQVQIAGITHLTPTSASGKLTVVR